MAAAAALLAAALFGAAAPVSKVLLREYSALQLAGLLYLGACIGVLPAARRPIASLAQAGRANLRRLLGAVICGGVVAPVCLLLALRVASAGSVSLWLNLEVAATAVLGQLFFADRLGRRAWYGVLGVVLAGALLSIGEGGAGLYAAPLVAVACLGWGLDNNLTSLIDGLRPAQVAFWKGLAAGTVNLTLGLIFDAHAGSARAAGMALGIGALSYGASIALYIAAAQQLGATRAQVIFASAPFWGLVLAVAVLGESVSFVQAAASAVFLVALFLLLRDPHAHLHKHGAVAHQHFHFHDDGHHAHTHSGPTPAGGHSHWHVHEPLAHSHPHWPDLHHRHDHGPEGHDTVQSQDDVERHDSH